MYINKYLLGADNSIAISTCIYINNIMATDIPHNAMYCSYYSFLR